MNEATPLVSNVSFLVPALTATVMLAKLESLYSVATLTPLSRVVT